MVENLPDELLLEILTRVGDCESIIRCTSVSKRWFSLIAGNSKLDHRFTHRRRPQVGSQLIGYPAGATHRYCEVGLRKTGVPNVRLDFLPWERAAVTIRAAAGDLLLVSGRDRELCVVNPLTKQAVVLPRCPTNEATRWGLAFESKRCDARVRCNCDIRYKAVLMWDRRRGHGDFICSAEFRSETGQWSQSEFRCPKSSGTPTGPNRSSKHRVFTFNNNALLWPVENSRSIAKFCPFKPPKLRLSYVPMPKEYRSFATERLLLGSSRGRLCLAQTVWDYSRNRQVLRVWEHDDDGSGWLMAHDVQCRVSHMAFVSVCGFHPSDRDNLLVLRGGFVYEHDIAKRVLKRVSGLSKTKLNAPFSAYFALFRYSKPTFIPPPLPTPLSPSSPLFSTFKLLLACLVKLCSKSLSAFSNVITFN